MNKYCPQNERIKRAYFEYQEGAKQMAPATVDQVAAALAEFERHTGFTDFRKFHIQQARGFKTSLMDARNHETGKPGKSDDPFPVVGNESVFPMVGRAIGLQRRYGNTCSVLYGLLFAAAPASNVLLTWLGYADQWTFALMSLSVVTGNLIVAACAGLIMGWNHFEIGCFTIAACSAALWFIEPGKAVRWGAVSAAGLMLGKLSLYGYFQFNSMELTRTRLGFIRDYGIGHMVLSSTANVFLMVLSSFGGLWLVIALLQRSDLDIRFRRAAMAGFSICALAVPVVLDRTRIFAVISWPVILLLLTNADRNWLMHHKRRIIRVMVIAAAIPGIIVWDRTVYSSTISYDLYTAYSLARSGTLPSNLFLGSPFGINASVNVDALKPQGIK